jgi:hypothetical protein
MAWRINTTQNKLKMNTLTVIRYTFHPYFDGYYQNGNWYSNDGRQLKEKYYNGRVCIDCNKKRYGIVKLRTFAKRIEIKEETLPF